MATMATMAALPIPGLADEEHAADRDSFEPECRGLAVQHPTLSTHRPGRGGTCAEGSGLEEFPDSPSICSASRCIS